MDADAAASAGAVTPGGHNLVVGADLAYSPAGTAALYRCVAALVAPGGVFVHATGVRHAVAPSDVVAHAAAAGLATRVLRDAAGPACVSVYGHWHAEAAPA